MVESSSRVNAVEQLVQILKRPDVTELVLASGRPPLGKVAGAHRALSPQSLSTAEILGLLRLLATPAPHGFEGRPAQWQTQTASAGAVEVTAVQRGDVLQVRFVLAPAGAPATAGTGAAATARASGSAHPVPAAPRSAPGTAPRPPSTFVRSMGDPVVDLARPAGVGRAEVTLEAPSRAEEGSGLELARPLGAPVQSWEGNVSLQAADAVVGSGLELEDGSGLELARPVRSQGAAGAGVERRVGSLDALLDEARALKASDLHVVAGRPPLFRIAGSLGPREHATLSPEQVEALCLPLIPERLRQRFEAEGSCDFALDRDGGRYRVNLGRQRTGLKACLRIIPRAVPTLASLGLPESIAKATEQHQGLIVVTGPSGSGKTSTLAALVDVINAKAAHHLLSVEDPVEYVHSRKQAVISQREVGTHTRTFASALKGSLREDPDVIVVGELRDTETVRMAIAASETGHLVMATMNTPNAAKTIDRLIDLFPPGDQAQVRMSLSTGLRLIISQRLVPTADGQGLCVAAELLPGSVALGNLIREEKTYQIPSLQQRGKSLGIVRLDDSLADLVRSGRTTLEFALPHAQSPDDLAALLGPGTSPARPAVPPPPAADPKAAVGAMLGRVGSFIGRK